MYNDVNKLVVDRQRLIIHYFIRSGDPMDGELMKINSNGVLTIPARFRKAGFEANHYVNISLEEDGSLKITPIEAIPKHQLGFHTEAWLKKERRASKDLHTGKAKTYKNKEAFLKTLSKW